MNPYLINELTDLIHVLKIYIETAGLFEFRRKIYQILLDHFHNSEKKHLVPKLLNDIITFFV